MYTNSIGNGIGTGNVQQPNIVVRWVDLTNVYLVHRTPADYMNNTGTKHSSKHTTTANTTGNSNTGSATNGNSSKGRKIDDDILSLLQKKKKTLPSSHG